VMLGALILAPGLGHVEGSEFLFQIGEVDAFTEGKVEIRCSPTPRFPTRDSPSRSLPHRGSGDRPIGTEGTIVDALPADFVASAIYPRKVFRGRRAGGSQAPFDFQLIPTTGFPSRSPSVRASCGRPPG